MYFLLLILLGGASAKPCAMCQCYDRVNIVDCSGHKLTSVPSLDWSVRMKTEKLYLNDNHIQTLNISTENWPMLRKVYTYGNRLTACPRLEDIQVEPTCTLTVPVTTVSTQNSLSTADPITSTSSQPDDKVARTNTSLRPILTSTSPDSSTNNTIRTRSMLNPADRRHNDTAVSVVVVIFLLLCLVGVIVVTVCLMRRNTSRDTFEALPLDSSTDSEIELFVNQQPTQSPQRIARPIMNPIPQQQHANVPERVSQQNATLNTPQIRPHNQIAATIVITPENVEQLPEPLPKQVKKGRKKTKGSEPTRKSPRNHNV